MLPNCCEQGKERVSQAAKGRKRPWVLSREGSRVGVNGLRLREKLQPTWQKPGAGRARTALHRVGLHHSVTAVLNGATRVLSAPNTQEQGHMPATLEAHPSSFWGDRGRKCQILALKQPSG